MKKVIMTKGLPACGKTTWAKEQMKQFPGHYKRINKDDLRAMLDDGKWSKHNEKLVLKVRDSLILAALQEGYHVIVDDTNLHDKHMQAIRELVKGQATVEIQDFTDIPLEVCIERDRQRPNYVGEQAIRSMYRNFLQPKPPVIQEDVNLPYAILCDLDGTLALMNGRNPYDASTCENDLINNPVADILDVYSEAGTKIILMSGRGQQHRPHTERWLKVYSIFYHSLFMRAEGDNRKDATVKRELYELHIQGRYNVRFVLDDRDQVVELWRSLGLTCMQVAYGDY